MILARYTRTTTYAALALLICGCEEPEATRTAAQVTDSAGIQVLTHDLAGTTVPVLATVGEPTLEIGTLDGPPEYSFSRILNVRVMTNGSVVVADAGTREVTLYSSEGTHQVTMGGRGDGPGEFSGSPQIAGLAGDSIFVWDDVARRVTAFSSKGEVVSTARVQPDAAIPVWVTRLANGTYLSRSRWISPNAEDTGAHDVRLELDSALVELLDPTGAPLDTLRIGPDAEYARMRQDRGGGIYAMQMMPRPLTSRSVLLADGSTPIVGTNRRFGLAWMGDDGQPARLLRVQDAWPTTPAAEIRARVEAQLAAESEDGRIDPRTRRVYDMFMPETLPAFEDALIAQDGSLWISSYRIDRTTESNEWLVFSPTLELEGRVRTPTGFRVHEVGSDWIIGAIQDAFDVPYVRRYPLEQTP